MFGSQPEATKKGFAGPESLRDPISLAFPPKPLDEKLSHMIISDFCAASAPEEFKEAGCAVCGQLTPLKKLSSIWHIKHFLHILENPSATRKERYCETDPVKNLDGPVLDMSTDFICLSCHASVQKGIVPSNALCNGLWLGGVPQVLSELSFVECLLVSHIQHNSCFVKIISHVISFESPLAKIYDILPPPKKDIDEVLAILFTGPNKPTEEDLKRTPLLVRHHVVFNALSWLCNNHTDYQHVKFFKANFNEYKENDTPVDIIYQHSLSNKVPEDTSVFDMTDADGTDNGVCPIVVHSIVGEQLPMTV
ncbi:hypothetical protein EV421DRAFT_1893120 [Armillaria borealis]|uniref:DUF6570 domain-containing protein n=1 Tax=Armillaria borealis TaxID=47425 RepID=A0AA39IZH9_9AGAR|nr:hypothetical protein EV421DRAFT_1893120 [Armillaria borealis]